MPCRREAPEIERFVAAHPEMTMVGIDVEDNARAARAFYRRFGWTHPSIEDPNGRLAAKLGLIGLPTTLFLTRRHREVARIVGATDLPGLEKGLRLAEQARGERSSSQVPRLSPSSALSAAAMAGPSSSARAGS